VEYVRPGGAFYLMVDVSAGGESAQEFAQRLLVEHGVAVVPGDAFGSLGAGMVRVSLAAADELIERGLDSLAAALHEGSARGRTEELVHPKEG
jgi:aspartate/methionine/tyrosine aminotransferase